MSDMAALPCLWCSAPLPPADGAELVTCGCGVSYSARLIDGIDRDLYQRALNRDGWTVTRDGNRLQIIPDGDERWEWK